MSAAPFPRLNRPNHTLPSSPSREPSLNLYTLKSDVIKGGAFNKRESYNNKNERDTKRLSKGSGHACGPLHTSRLKPKVNPALNTAEATECNRPKTNFGRHVTDAAIRSSPKKKVLVAGASGCASESMRAVTASHSTATCDRHCRRFSDLQWRTGSPNMLSNPRQHVAHISNRITGLSLRRKVHEACLHSLGSAPEVQWAALRRMSLPESAPLRSTAACEALPQNGKRQRRNASSRNLCWSACFLAGEKRDFSRLT